MAKNYPFFDPNYEFNLEAHKKNRDSHIVSTTYFEEEDMQNDQE